MIIIPKLDDLFRLVKFLSLHHFEDLNGYL